MEYHQMQQQQQQQQPQHHMHQFGLPPPPQPPMQQQQQQIDSQGTLILPNDMASGNEKALMWSHAQYVPESGYSTQTPSISSTDSYLNAHENAMDTTIASTLTACAEPVSFQQPSQAFYDATMQLQTSKMHSTQATDQQQSATSAAAATAESSGGDDNAVANWINYQDNSEMALKAIPDLLKLLVDEDLVVVQQAAILLNQMSRTEGPRIAMIQTPSAVKCLVDCLITTADLETARSLVGALYGVSMQKPLGVQAIVESKALEPLVKMLSAPMETIVSYSITTLHNVLLGCTDAVKQSMRKMGAIHQMIPLLSFNENVKFLSIVVDCLQLLAFGNKETKQIIHDLGGTDLVVHLLASNTCVQYQKLLLNITRLLKVLSVCSLNKPKLVSLNIMQILSNHLLKPPAPTPAPNSAQQQPAPPATSSTTASDIIQNSLITLRNLSDAATRLNGLELLIQNLILLLSSTSADFSQSILAAGILSNLTCNNESNKKAAVKCNGVKILLKLIETSMLVPSKHSIIEPLICALRHVTNRHADMLVAQAQFRSGGGIGLVVTQLMSMQPRIWSCIKAALGLVRNICSNQLNANDLRSNCIIEKLMQILYDAYTDLQMKMSAQPALCAATVIKTDDVNMFDIVDASATALLVLAKEYQNQLIMKDLDCIGFFVQMFYSNNALIQKAAASLLAELATSKECSEVIEQQPGIQHFIQANFCNQYGQLKSVDELVASMPPPLAAPGPNPNNNAVTNASIILQHVTTLMHRTQEHRNQRAFFIQQQQQQQQQQHMQRQQQYNMYGPPQQQQQQLQQAPLPPPQMQQQQPVIMQTMDPYMQQQQHQQSYAPIQQQQQQQQQQHNQLQQQYNPHAFPPQPNSVNQAFF